MIFSFDNSYARLPERFFTRTHPAPVARPTVLRINQQLANNLGLDAAELQTPAALAVLCGNQSAPGAEPLAMAYAGHQFGSFVPQLGDGRAILLGEILAPSGERFDIQLKGSGRTPFSRSGDGRAWIGPVLREYLISEAMQALGIPTTRSLAAVATGEPVYRESPLPGAVLTRVARSHVRVGTFEYFAARQDHEAVAVLADYVIARHFPEAAEADDSYAALLAAVAERQADLIVAWLSVGFIHGVMNTDNMSIAGETIDYGPCAFMDTYDPTKVFSSIDHGGRYAYANQPRIAHWNLACLALSLRPILNASQGDDQASAAIDRFQVRFDQAWLDAFARKFGITAPEELDIHLIRDFLDLLFEQQADFTNSFRALCSAAAGDDAPLEQEIGGAAIASWLERWRSRLAREPMPNAQRAESMRRVNPIVIPRNHRVEQALDAALLGDLDPFERLLEVLQSPWEDSASHQHFRSPPRPHEVVQATFCGT